MTERSSSPAECAPAIDRGRRIPGRAAIPTLVLFLSYAYFYGGGGWNQNSRFDLVRAIVERGTLQIDAYEDNTGDKALHGGHVYTDKAPGASFTAVPAVALARTWLKAAGGNRRSPAAVKWLSYVATVAAGALPAAVVGLCLFLLARRIGASEDAAALVALTCGLGTPLWAYATLLWGHALAAGCLTTALLAADRLRDDSSSRGEFGLGALVGAAGGWAVVTEFPAVVPSAVLAGLAVRHAWPGGWSRVARVTGGLALGGGLGLAVLAAYQWTAFGSPFHVGYASEEDRTLLRAGFYGITMPRVDVMAELLWGSYRGLLPLAPALVVAPVGLWMLWRQPETRWTAAAVMVSTLYYFFLNSAYAHWDGGWSYGPRHLGPALALVCLGLAPVLMKGGRWVRAAILTLALVGAGQSLVAVSTTPQPPSWEHQAPMRQLLWPAFVQGQLSLNTQSVLDAAPRGAAGPRAAWNLGERAGLEGKASLVPLFLLYVLAGIAWLAAKRARP